MENFLSLSDSYLARQRIVPIIRKTPLIESPALIKASGSNVSLKLENLQVTGSFKLRGATNKIMSLSKQERELGVVTVSSGNHGRAVSYVSEKLGIQATICVAQTVPENKRQAIKALGAELIVAGENYDEALAYGDKLAEEHRLTMVHAFDDLDIIAGQGTIGIELFEDHPEIDTVIVPLSGGGLISGIAFVVKAINPKVHVVGVTMERGPAMVESLKAGKITDIVEEPTLADALMGGLNNDNQYTFKMVQQFVDETVLVSEEEIASAMLYCLEKHHMAVEGGGAVGIAAVIAHKVNQLGKNAAVVVSGGNVSMDVLRSIMGTGE
jgi:threonine dehydratase